MAFIDVKDYPFTRDLEAAYPAIRREMEALTLDRFKEWYERDMYTNLWLVYGLIAMGKKLADNCKDCPETMKVLDKIPDLTTAGFSCLLPGTHIQPHEGFTKAVLRCHLGLSVPEPEACVLKVAGEEGHWREGKTLIFDDTLTHEAWNKGTKPRIVLLLDFKDRSKTLPLADKIRYGIGKTLVHLAGPMMYGNTKKKEKAKV